MKRSIAIAVFAAFSIPFAFAQEPEPVPTPMKEIVPGRRGGPVQRMNPDISLIGLFSATGFNTANPIVFDGGHDPKVNGFNIQQVEMAFGSSVDPYFRADAYLVLVDGGIEVEEAYATTLDFPWNLQLKAGHFYTPIGRNNPTHPHSWDFVDRPLVISRILSGDGARNPGAQLSWLTPLPWYSELIASAQNSTGETARSFLGESGEEMRSLADVMATFRTNNFIAISDSFSLNLGGTFMTGPNAAGGNTHTRILGGDLYLRYRRPEGLSYVSLQAEVLRRSYDQFENSAQDDWGYYVQLTHRLAEPFDRWNIGLRYDWMSEKKAFYMQDDGAGGLQTVIIGEANDVSRRHRISPMITFFPSEFSKARLQYNYDKFGSQEEAQHTVSLQFEFLIGAHGAHKF